MFRNRSRSARKTARQVQCLVTRQQEAAKQAYRKLVQIMEQSVSQAQQVLEVLTERRDPQVPGLKDTLETFLPRAEQVNDQTMRWVFQDEKVPANEKIVSLFEPHSAIIRRGKAGKPVEYGRKVWLDEVERGIVTHWEVLDGNPSTKISESPAWMLTSSALGSHLPKPVPTAVCSPPTMKPQPNAKRSKGLRCPSPARNQRNVASMRNNPGSAMLVNGMRVSKGVTRSSNVATSSTVVSTTAKRVSSVGLPGA